MMVCSMYYYSARMIDGIQAIFDDLAADADGAAAASAVR